MQSCDVKVDLHVHSCFSGPKTSWLLQLAGASECYTTPKKVYELATARGMNLVTICDHDEIAGALELCGTYDNTFVSEEISAKFPDDDCLVHVIALNIDESQHREIQRLRANIYELAAYLEAEAIGHVLCHPLAPVNRRVSEAHLKQCFMMFRAVEVRNGTRDATLEEQARRILSNITPAMLATWAEQYPQAPLINREARYAVSGGSDDHAGLSIARAHTAFHGEPTGAGLVKAMQARQTKAQGDTATADVISHNIYGVIGSVLKSKGQLPGASGQTSPSPAMTQALMRYGMMAASSGLSFDWNALIAAGHTDEAQNKLHDVLEHVLVMASREAVGELKNALLSAHLAEAADAVSGVLKTALMGAPAVCAMRSYALDRRAARELARPLAGEEARARPLRVAVLSDTVDETNGVALGLRRFIAHARAAGLDGRLLGLGDGQHVALDEDGLVRVPAIMRHRLRDYPQINFGVPHLPSLMHYLVSEDIDLIQCSTPGPMGLAGLALGRLAGIPVIGQYHTDLPVYASRITGDALLSDICSSWVGWFYGALDQVLSPSDATRARLQELGVPAEKIRLVPRGIDLELFSHAQRDNHAFSSLGVESEPKVLYVGRISREKGLDSLVSAFLAVAEAVPQARLLLVGDGPYAEKLAQAVPRERVIFAGERRGADLARFYASSDLFVFPSETETFGNAVVEAQAAGLPVIVSSRGGAHENVVDGVTGLVVDAQNPEALGRAIRDLLTHPMRRRRMARAAAKHAQRYNPRDAALHTFDLYRSILGTGGSDGHDPAIASLSA